MSTKADNNWMSYYGDNPNTSDFVNPTFPKNYSDIMKFSECTNVKVSDRIICAGKENCVDAVRGSNYHWQNCNLEDGAGVASITIKGSVDGWHLDSCLIGRASSWTDVEVGMFDKYWHFGRKPTRNGRITASTRPDGKPIRVWLWDAEKPVVENTNVKIIKVPAIVWFPYFALRYLMTKLGL